MSASDPTFSRRQFGAAALPVPTTAAAADRAETWESVDRHVAAPEWFQDAKFGVSP